MLGMNGKELSKDQEERIKKIEEEWFAEVDKLEPIEEFTGFNQKLNEPRRRLEKKYMAQIRKIMEEDIDGQR